MCYFYSDISTFLMIIHDVAKAEDKYCIQYMLHVWINVQCLDTMHKTQEWIYSADVSSSFPLSIFLSLSLSPFFSYFWWQSLLGKCFVSAESSIEDPANFRWGSGIRFLCRRKILDTFDSFDCASWFCKNISKKDNFILLQYLNLM